MAAGGGAKRGKEGCEREPEVETTDWGVWDLGITPVKKSRDITCWPCIFDKLPCCSTHDR